MVQRWHETAEKYRAKADGSAREALIARVAAELERFMSSDEGPAAVDLLGASKREIVLAQQSKAEGGIDFIVFDDQGFKKRYEFRDGDTMMMSTPSRISPLDCRGVAEALFAFASAKHLREGVLSWLRGELNKIAADADAPVR